jgi:hypothetical protein
MLPILRELAGIWQLHILLTAVGREQYALAPAQNPEVNVVSCSRQ